MFSSRLLFVLAILMLISAGAVAQTALPVLSAIGNQSTNENANLNFGVSASDADLTNQALSTPTCTNSDVSAETYKTTITSHADVCSSWTVTLGGLDRSQTPRLPEEGMSVGSIMAGGPTPLVGCES